MPPISLLIKPASSLCNMRCTYCFYEDVAQNRTVPSYGIMSPDTAEKVAAGALAACTGSCHFAFQGGEPTLAGLDYYRGFVGLVEKYRTGQVQVTYSIQTNGYAIDREWVDFFADNGFLVGLSLDGTKETNDLFRKDTEGKGSYARIIRTAQLLQSKEVPFNILTVITGKTAGKAGKIYRFYKNIGFTYQQYIPCLDPLEPSGNSGDCSLTASQYGGFLKQLFDLWYSDWKKGKPVSIRYFDNLLGMLKGYPPESCAMAGRCSCQNVVEADGSVYPCDFYVLDQYRLGNLYTDSFTQIKESGEQSEFVRSSMRVAPECQACRWVRLCRGGCRREREVLENGLTGKNRFCEAYRNFFEYAVERLVEVAGMIR